MISVRLSVCPAGRPSGCVFFLGRYRTDISQTLYDYNHHGFLPMGTSVGDLQPRSQDHRILF